MSNQWSNGQFQQGLPAEPGQVRLFDPTHFQTQTLFSQTGKSVPESKLQNIGSAHPQHASQTTHSPATHSSWDSWGGWSFDGSNQQQETDYGMTQSKHSFGESVTDNPYYGGVGNQAWNGADHAPHQPQSYTHSDTPSVGYNQTQQQHHPQQGFQSYGGVSFSESHDHSSDSNSLHGPQSDVHFSDQCYNPVEQELGEQRQNYNHDHQQDYNHDHGQDYNYDLGQIYNHSHEHIFNQDSSHAHNQTQPLYDQPHDGDIWAAKNDNGQWANNQQDLPLPEVGKNEQLQNNLTGVVSDKISQVTNDFSSSSDVIGPVVEVFDNDDDGTTTEIPGRDGDGDGDVQLDSQRHVYDCGQIEDNSSSGVNQFLSVVPQFHRAHSEISNASLSTLNLSVSEDDDGHEPLHNIEELVHRMEEVDLARRHGEIQNKDTDNGEDQMNVDQSLFSEVQDSFSDFQSKQKRGDYSGFGNEIHNPVTLSLEKNIRSPSPIGDHPDSAESGGSSSLADWEFISPQTRHTTHNRNSSLDNNVMTYRDKPDGGSSLSPGLDSSKQKSQNLFTSPTCDPTSHSGLQNSNPPASPWHPHTSSAFSETSDIHCDTIGRSGSPFVAAFTDHRQEGSQMPSQASTVSSLNITSNTLPVVSPEDRATNLSKRDVVKSLSRSGISQHPSDLSSSSSLSSLPDFKQTSSSEALKSHGLTATPLKIKLSTGSLTDDGNCTSKRDPDRTIKTTEKVSTQDKDEPPVRSSSRNSEVSSQQSRHNSAFHAVARLRQTAMSPATTLWDNSEAPAYNILLAPAMPLIIPNLNTSQVSVNSAAEPTVLIPEKVEAVVESSVIGSRNKDQSLTARLSVETKDGGRRDAHSRSKEGSRKEHKNRSYDSLDEVDAIPDEQRDRSYDSQPSDPRESSYNQDPYRQNLVRRDPDRPASRTDRPSSRSDRSGHYHYERPINRTEDPSRRHYGYYRDYGNVSYDERYDRPRSRQDESQISRPSSRSVQDIDRPRSRSGYDQDRDYYYKDRQRAYGYDNYGRHADYHDERERYYRYYKEKEARYSRGYLEEYYGGRQAEYYYQRQQGRQPNIQESGQSSRSQSRGSTPAMAPSPAIPPPPAVKAPSGHGYYGNLNSRPDSHTDYNRDYYNRGYTYDGYNAFYDGGYGYDPYTYGYTYPTYEEYSQGHNQGRMTPPKYSYPHARGCFGPAGQLIKVLPNHPTSGQPAVVELQDVQAVLESCPESDELRRFPGPLTRNHTHKKDVLLFCQQKAKSCGDNINMVDRESAQLIWRFLELLIKQNGSVVGTDLADLLLEGHEPSTHEYSTRGVKISQSPEMLDSVLEGNSEEGGSTRDSPAVRVTSDRTVINSANREREKWVDRFRNLLLYGHKKDALECAMKNNLWGHALFLASKMDTRTHANVMARFANGAIQMNDPLQTLYQLMSGRPPAAVTCVVDDRWGDWRPHLAMILSNQTLHQDIDRKSIATLGDTLAAKGCLHASHFCYLMAQTTFGSYMRKTSKIVLIGSNHNLPVDEFAANEAVQCTEVYEYAQSLGSSGFCLPHFQTFKYLYACRLADYGMPLEALQYCEVIANNINQYPSWFHSGFVKLVYQLSSKLKFCDPQRQLAGEDVDDSLWLQHLEKICFSYDDGSVQPLSGTATPAGYPGTTTSSESGDYSSYGNGYRGDATTPSTMSSAPIVGAYGQHQLNHADSTGFSNGQHDLGGVTGQVHSADAGQEADYSQQQYDYNQWQQTYGYNYSNYGDQQQQQQQQQLADADQTTDNYQHQFTQPQVSHPPAHDDVGVLGHSYPAGGDPSFHGGSQLDSSSATTHLTPSSTSTQPDPQVHPQDYGNFDLAQPWQQHETGPAARLGPSDDRDDAVDEIDGTTSSFDYFGNVGTQKIVAPSHKYRHLSGSSVGSTSKRRTISGGSSGSMQSAPQRPAQPPQQQPAGGKGFDNMAKSGHQDNGGSGWWGGIFNKFKVKGKNEMILPDDKNPAIVWDPVKKKWTNADGTEDEAASTAPPPKDTELISKPPGISSVAAGPPPSIPTGGNRFSLKAKGARNQYVDVTNPKAVSVPTHLFNVLPGATANTTTTGLNLFLPGTVPVPGDAAPEANSLTVNSGPLMVPDSADKPITDNSDISSSNQTAPSMPMLYNPSSLKSGQAASTSTGAGLKFGQRRTYPK